MPHSSQTSTAARRSRSICSPVEPVEPAEPGEPAELVEPVDRVRCRRRASAGGTTLAPAPCRGHGAVMAVRPFRETDHHGWGGPEDHENDAGDDREDEAGDGRAARGRPRALDDPTGDRLLRDEVSGDDARWSRFG